MDSEKSIFDFYNNGAEINRLENGLGIIEFYRSKEIIEGYLGQRQTIYDIGGGVGKYSQWLAEKGHNVTLIELAPNAVKYAIDSQADNVTYKAQVGDARSIDKPNESADIVLLMGPLYHLQSKAERNKALSEAHRVLKKGGLLFAVGISKFSSTTWSLSVYGNDNYFIDDDIYMNMLRQELTTGKHNRPEEYPFIIADAYFHTLTELKDEIMCNGFTILNSHAIEGCIWFTPQLNAKWENVDNRSRLLNIIHLTENEETLMGMSPHFMVVAKK